SHLAGESADDEPRVSPAARREGDGVALSVAMNVKQGLHFWCGDYVGAIRVSDEANQHLAGVAGTVTLQLVHLISALSRIQAAPHDRATRQSVRQALALHRNWAAGAPANYAAPCALIEGAWARARGQHSKAERFLTRAIELAAEYQLPLIHALAHEEGALLHAQIGRPRVSAQMLRSAYQGYLSLGIAVRAERLAEAHPWLLSRDLMSAGSAGIDPVSAHQVVHALPTART